MLSIKAHATSHTFLRLLDSQEPIHSMATTLADIHPEIIHTHILRRLDGPSLTTTATASSYLNTLCSDHSLWSHISQSTWPSITHPRLHDIISTFPAGHRSFFHDSFPPLIAAVNRRPSWSSSKSDRPSTPHLDRSSVLVSAVDIRYQNDVIYSTVNFTETGAKFLSSPARIELIRSGPEDGQKDVHGISRSIDLTVDKIVGADKATISHLTESMTLSWILIDPIRKRACNLSSVVPVSVKADWVTNETHLRFVTVLPGFDPNEMVQCRIHVTLGVGERGVGLKVKEVVLEMKDLDSCCVNGMEFLVVIERGIMEENNVRRRVVGDERLDCYKEFKKMTREKKEWVKNKKRKGEVAVNLICNVIVLFFFLSFYLVVLR